MRPSERSECVDWVVICVQFKTLYTFTLIKTNPGYIEHDI